MVSRKLNTLGLLKVKVFWNKGYGVISSIYAVTNKILSIYSNFIVDLVMWPNLSNSDISMRRANITLILQGFD